MGAAASGTAGSLTVGSFAANQFGLYDMAGNVFQWVQDCYHGNYDGAPTDGSAWTGGDCSNRVVRGGSWNYNSRDLRSAVRLGYITDERVGDLGFRVGRTLSYSLILYLLGPGRSVLAHSWGERRRRFAR